MKRKVLCSLLFLLISAGLWAQKRITGTVYDQSTQQPVIGATVAVAGNTGQGTTTDAAGKFSLELPDDAAAIRVSYVGYETQTVPVGESTVYNIHLQTNEQSLEQLVVVGYGTQRKANLTGAVSTVDVEKTFQSKPLLNADKALQGVVPGLSITYGNGGLTEGPTIRLRGVGSVNGSNRPLILVDNVETPDLSVIDPNDIESISVLKDAASAAIYGTRAAFGVVLIKTKSGRRNQKPKVTYSNNFSWNTPTVLPDFADPVKGLQGILEGSVRGGNSSPDVFGMQLSKLIDGIKNWRQKYAGNRKGIEMVPGEDFVFNNGSERTYFYRVWDVKDLMIKKWTPQQKQNLQISGGSDKIGYYLSFGYGHEGGIMKMNPDDIKKYNITTSVNASVTKWLDVDAKMMYRNFEYDYPYQYQAYWYYMWRWGAYFPYGTYQGHYFRHSPAYLAGAQTSTVRDNYSRINLGATLRPLPHVTIRADYTIDRDNSTRHNVGGPIIAWDFWNAKTPLHNVASTSQDEVDYTSGRGVNSTTPAAIINAFNAYATYDNIFAGKHHVKLLVGVNAEDDENIIFSAERRNLLDPDKGELGLATGDQFVSGSHTNAAYAGYFGRINYDYKGKYLLELNGRYDGSSAFSPYDRWAFFSSASAGYRLSEEPFMQFIKPLVSDLKLRASLGSIGNQDVGGQYFIPTMTPNSANWIVGPTQVQTFTNPLAVGRSVTWEKVKTLDIGADVSFLKNYINLSFDWYERNTIGMLSTNAVAATFGATAPRTNQGNLRDRGWEVTVNGNYDITTNWHIYGTFTLADNKAVVTKWNNPSKLISQYYPGATYGDIWGFATDRFFREKEDLSKLPDQSLLEAGNFTYGSGDIKFKDLNGDGKIDGGASTATDHGDLTVIGNTQPRYEYSARLGSVWKNFDIDVFLQGVGKRSWWGIGDMVIPLYRGGDILYAHQLDYWTPDNTDAKYPKPYVGNSRGTVAGLEAGGNNFYPQTKYLMNLAYFRLKNLTIGYSLPSSLLNKIHIEKLRIYVSGENLGEISNVGVPLDPEITDGQSGFTGRTFPFQRNYSFGLQLTF